MKPSRIIQGLMRVADMSDESFFELLRFDLENGISMFDIADIYGGGECERKLGRILQAHPELREKMFIQSKVSICGGEYGGLYDLSYKHIKEGVEAILSRMGISYLDSLLLHRPDVLMDAEEVAKAFDELHKEGKVLHFGVSNFSIGMINYLEKRLHQKIEYNQVQLGLGHMPMISEAVNFNMDNHDGISRTEDTLFLMKEREISIQAWSPFVAGFFVGSLFDEEKFPRINAAMNKLAAKHHTSKCAIATAFLLKLDKNLYVITGSINPSHVKECLDGENIDLTRDEWYYLFREAEHMLP